MGRLVRVVLGLGGLVWAIVLIADDPSPGDVLAAAALVVLGLSFLAGGIVGNPGCEVSALPNLVLPPDKRVHFV